MSGISYFFMVWQGTVVKTSRGAIEEATADCTVFFRTRLMDSLRDKSRIKPAGQAVPGQTKLSMIIFEKAQRFVVGRLPVEFLGMAVAEERINGSRFLKIRVLESNGKEGSHQIFCFARICDTHKGSICKEMALLEAV